VPGPKVGEVRATFVTHDSASIQGVGNGKGDEFDHARAALVEGARMGDYQVVLIWALDRLSRRGYKDLSGVIDKLASYGRAGTGPSRRTGCRLSARSARS
jgi:hypothetical protein